MAPAGARKRGPTKNPGTRRRTAARTVQDNMLDRAGVENSSGRSDSNSRKRGPCTSWEFNMPEHVPGRRTSGLGVLDRVLGVLHVVVGVIIVV